MWTAIASPAHVLPSEIQAPTLKDGMGNGDFELRRQWTRTLRAWTLQFNGHQEKLEELSALLDYAQGDTLIWFDGAGTLDIAVPVLVGIGNGSKTDFDLPHRNVFVASAIIYLNGSAVNTWSPLGGDGIIMNKIRLSSAPGNYAQLKAKYRRKAKTVLKTDQAVSIQRIKRSLDDVQKNIYSQSYILQELPK